MVAWQFRGMVATKLKLSVFMAWRSYTRLSSQPLALGQLCLLKRVFGRWRHQMESQLALIARGQKLGRVYLLRKCWLRWLISHDKAGMHSIITSLEKELRNRRDWSVLNKHFQTCRLVFKGQHSIQCSLESPNGKRDHTPLAKLFNGWKMVVRRKIARRQCKRYARRHFARHALKHALGLWWRWTYIFSR